MSALSAARADAAAAAAAMSVGGKMGARERLRMDFDERCGICFPSGPRPESLTTADVCNVFCVCIRASGVAQHK